MKIMNYLMIIGLFVGMYKFSLFAAFRTASEGAAQPQSQQQQRQQRSASTSNAGGGTVARQQEQQEPLPTDVANAAVILNNYQKKRDEFLKDLKTARNAYTVVNSKSASSRDMQVLAAKMRPILDADERILVAPVKTERDIVSLELSAARDNLAQSVEEAFEKGTPDMRSEAVKLIIEHAQEYLDKGKTIKDVENLLKNTLKDNIENDFERDEFVGKLVAHIEKARQEKLVVPQEVKENVKQDASDLLGDIDRNWLEHANYSGPSLEWINGVISITNFMSKNMSSQEIRDFLVEVKKTVNNKYVQGGLSATEAQQQTDEFIKRHIAPKVPKSAIDLLNAPQVKQAAPSWWAKWWSGAK